MDNTLEKLKELLSVMKTAVMFVRDAESDILGWDMDVTIIIHEPDGDPGTALAASTGSLKAGANALQEHLDGNGIVIQDPRKN